MAKISEDAILDIKYMQQKNSFLLIDKGMYNRNGHGEKELFSRQAFLL